MITISGLKKHFGSKTVLDGVDIHVPKSTSLVVIGGSGSGKSVLIKSILGLVHPDAGSILVDGIETVGMHGKPRDAMMARFGMLFQGGALFDSRKVWQNVVFGVLAQQHVSMHDARKLAIECLARVGLKPETADLYPAELSGGMQKRVALARAIAAKPEIIFFDEPTTGLDPIMADVINDLIVDCVKELGATTITITHDMASVRKIADSVALLYQGKIIWHGAKDALDTSGNAYVDQFIHGRAHGPIDTGFGLVKAA